MGHNNTKKRDNNFFKCARTYEELLKLNVNFLQGRIFATPYHHGKIDEETVPLVTNLVALHKQAKMMTIEGQPGICNKGAWGVSEQRPYLCAFVQKKTMMAILCYVKAWPTKFIYTFTNGAHREVKTNMFIKSFNVTREKGLVDTRWKLKKNIWSDENFEEYTELVKNYPHVDFQNVWYMKMVMNVPYCTGDLEAELLRAV
jgi:hypothetical protein